MTFKVAAVALAAADTTVFETPINIEGAMHGLVFTNPTAGALSLTFKFFDASEGTTRTILSGFSIAANAQFTWPKPINLNAGDRIIASGNGLVALHSTFIAEAVPLARGFTPRGEWTSAAAYQTNDIVSYLGSSYIAIQANTNQQPNTNPDDWLLLFATPSTLTDVSLVRPTTRSVRQVTQSFSPTSGSTVTFDLSQANVFVVTLPASGSVTIAAPTNAPASGTEFDFLMQFKITGTAALTFNSVFKFPGGVAPTLTVTNGKTDTLAAYTTDGGMTFQAFTVGQNA
jgi:hypothetical protein